MNSRRPVNSNVGLTPVQVNDMTERCIEAFFYGLFMDDNLLRSKGIVPMNPRPASVEGFGLRIGKRATLVPARHERSYGMVMGLTHQQLKTLYAGPGLEHLESAARRREGRTVDGLQIRTDL